MEQFSALLRLIQWVLLGAAVQCFTCQEWVSGNSQPSTPATCGENMECVPLYLCNDNDTINTDGNSIINFRSVSFEKNKNQGCFWMEKCCAHKKPKPVEVTVQPFCGESNPNGVGFTLKNIENGESQFAEYPWLVGIWQISTSCLYIAQGAGSLLAPNVVLTAAHKIINIDPANLKVRAGEWDILSEAEPKPHQDRYVLTKIIHENFDMQTGFNDVAILILESPFELAPHINTICLPNHRSHFDNKRCFVMGWGKREHDDLHYPNIMKKVELPIVPSTKCQNLLRNTRLGHNFELHSSFICAGAEKNKDACLGDGGAPLVCAMPDAPHRYQVAGIVAWGVDCGEENVPGVYANVLMLQPWISAKLSSLHIEYKYYNV